MIKEKVLENLSFVNSVILKSASYKKNLKTYKPDFVVHGMIGQHVKFKVNLDMKLLKY